MIATLASADCLITNSILNKIRKFGSKTATKTRAFVVLYDKKKHSYKPMK